MIRGTTPRLSFTLPFPVSSLVAAYITIKQFGNLVIERSLDDCEVQENLLTITLTQVETLSLDAGSDVYIQFRGKDIIGRVLASQISKMSVTDVLKEGEI